MIAVMDYKDSSGNIVITAGEKLPSGININLKGVARSEREAQEKLKEIAVLRLTESMDTSDKLRYLQLMYDYHRSMQLHYAFKYLELEALQKNGGING